MTALTLALGALLAVTSACGVLCGLAARSAFQRVDAAEDALCVERGVVAVQREEIAALALRLIDAGQATPLDVIRWQAYDGGAL